MKLHTPLINKAMKIAYDAHHSQLDKSGVPYIYHPAFLAAQMDTEDEIITALLHDVVEDTSITFADLGSEGFPQIALDALKLLTNTDGGDYTDYIRRVGTSPLAAKVKIADLRHNCDPTRNANLTHEDAERYDKKYGEAIRLLEERASEQADLQRKVENGDPVAMFLMGVEYYWGHFAPLNKRKAFDLLSRAMETGLEKDVPGSHEEYGECAVAWFLADMLLKDDDGILSTRTEPFWFEQPWRTASQMDRIFMCLTGRGDAERDLEKAGSIAHDIGYEHRYEHYADFHPAVELRDLIGRVHKKEAEMGNPKAMFWMGVKCYWGRDDCPKDRRKSFDMLSRAMEIGLPKDREYVSDDHSELNAARFLVPMILRDDDGVMSTRTKPLWFEKPFPPFEEKYDPPRPHYDPYYERKRAAEHEKAYRVSSDLREIFCYITGRGGVERDLKKAHDLAHSIVLELCFGDRDHDPSLHLRSILRDAEYEDSARGEIKLSNW